MKCETAPYPTVIFGADKISGSFVPIPSPTPKPPAPSPPTPTPPPIPVPKPKPPVGSTQPNFVLILQDDQDKYMGGWTPMKQSEEVVAKQGATATNWFIHTPVCCPSRGEIFSGRYFHSLRMPSAKDKGCMHIHTDPVNERSFGKHLGDVGYTMGYFGKHLNAPPSAPPPGYNCSTCRWFVYGGDTEKFPNCSKSTASGTGGCAAGGYVNSAFMDWEGGVPIKRGATPYNAADGFYQADRDGEHSGYTTAILANKTIAWIAKGE